MKKLLMLAVIASAVASCTDADIADSTKVGHDDSAPVFHASFDDEDTRTHIDDKVRLLWDAYDRISIFTTTYNQQYAFDGETGDNSGAFVKISDSSFATGSEIERNYAVYPYAKGNKISYDNILTVTLPAVQTYAENSFGMGANTMVAVTENGDDYFLKFRNVGGFIKLKLYGDNVTIANVSIRGHKSEPIAGKASVSAVYGYYPTVAMSDSATDTVTLDCGDGVRIGSTAEECTEFWLVVPPTVFSEGFTIVVTDIEGKIFTKSTSKRIEVIRNGVLSMSAIEVVTSIPTNQIWYTSSDGEIVEPYRAEGFGANIVSNTYENGKGVIAFDGDVTKIRYEAFFGCSSLTSINIPDSVTSIGNAAFYECNNLTNIIIPCKVMTIGIAAFINCCGLTSVTIPDSVTEIGYSAFSGCDNLTTFYGKFASTDNRCLIIDGKLVAFAPLGLTEYTIPNSVISIGPDIFNTYKLKSITIPDGVTEIGGYAFASNSMTSITIPDSVTSIGNYAFAYCDSLTSIAISDNIEEIGECAFFGCSSLTAFYGQFASLDNRCLILNEELVAFAQAGLEKYTIPDNISSIGNSTFGGCNRLNLIIIPNSVVKIGNETFSHCYGLTNIIIPDNVTEIGGSAFNWCNNLTNIYCKPIIPPDLGKDAFSEISLSVNIYVPTASVDAYKAAWGSYADKIVGYDF